MLTDNLDRDDCGDADADDLDAPEPCAICGGSRAEAPLRVFVVYVAGQVVGEFPVCVRCFNGHYEIRWLGGE